MGPQSKTVADSLALNHEVMTDPSATVVPGPSPTSRLQQLYWINATPMETSIAQGDHATSALQILETPLFTGATGFYQEGQDSAENITGSRQASALNTSVMAAAEANYGRMDESLRYVTLSPRSWIRNSQERCQSFSTARIIPISRTLQAVPW